jgi:hypothetical protein
MRWKEKAMPKRYLIVLIVCCFVIGWNILSASQALSQKLDGKDDIHSVDFRNFTYTVSDFCGKEFGKKQIRVRNGVYGTFSDWGLAVGNVVYGDLTGDGKDEAVVMTSCGGMHPEDEPYVFAMRNGSVLLLTRLESGNRAFGGYRNIDIKPGHLITERMGGRAACCPDFIEKKTYKWNGKSFVEVGKAQRRKFE